MNPFRTGKLVLFQVSYDRDWHYFEIPFYILIGVFGVNSIRGSEGDLLADVHLLVPLAGLVWCLCNQVQPSGRCVPTKESRHPRDLRSGLPGCPLGHDRLL